ncbi:MAG TPA: hypothetical protein VK019_07535 [Pseudomonas sp.]|nr:hypothetical protein [Pseudomonas sp.]
MNEPITKEQALAAYENDTKALAAALGITRSAIYQWADGPIPEAQALKLRYVLKPEVFGPDPAQPGEAA